MNYHEGLQPNQQKKLWNLEHVLSVAIRNYDIDAKDYWPLFYVARRGLIADWRTEKLAALPPQAQETIAPLLFVTAEFVPSLITPNSRELKPTGFQDEDTLAGEIKYVTDWPETPGGRWTEQGTYYE